MHRRIPLIVLLAVVCASRLGAVTMEKGPAYLTDSHGASGVVHGFLELSKGNPKYDGYWKGALDWLIAVARRDEAGRLYWPMSITAPEGHPSNQVNLCGMCHIITMFFEGHARCGDKRYLETALAACRSIADVASVKRETPMGTAYGWNHSYRPEQRSHGVLAGHSHGLGNFLNILARAYQAKPDPAVRDAIRGALINLHTRGRWSRDANKQPTVAWPALKNPRVVETGYCYGQAGVVIPLYQVHAVLPDLALPDGSSAESMADASLRYLVSVARKKGDGYVWPYMRHTEQTRNIGYGSGTGGIGWAFLRGTQVNRETDAPFATQCLRYARGAAEYAIGMVDDAGNRELTSPGGDGGFGVCGGAAGGAHLLIMLAEELRESDPGFAARLDKTTRRIAQLVIASAEDIDGDLVLPERGRVQRVNLALDYGQTGIVLGLARAGNHLQNDEILAAAKRVADYIVKHAVPEHGGFKFAQFHPLPD